MVPSPSEPAYFAVLEYPFGCLVTVLLLLWSCNVYRRLQLGVWSNFQPLLTALMFLALVVSAPVALDLLAYDTDDPQLRASAYSHVMLGTLYELGYCLLGMLFVAPFLLTQRSRLLRPRPRLQTEPGYPYDGTEPDR